MKKTRTQKLDDCHAAYIAAKTGKRPKQRTKDGSIPTHPIVPVPDIPEAAVLAECHRWLLQHRIFHDRHDCGAGDVSGAGYATYGIKFAGDIIGLTKQGQHFEIETKRGKGGRLSKGQQERMCNIRFNNGIYLIIHGFGELEYYNNVHHYFD